MKFAAPGIRTSAFAAALLAATLLVRGAAPADSKPREIELPPETIFYRESSHPGYALTAANCSACHSADYVAYQPPGLSRDSWRAVVDKMKTTFGAPLRDEDIAKITDYLHETYGKP